MPSMNVFVAHFWVQVSKPNLQIPDCSLPVPLPAPVTDTAFSVALFQREAIY